METVDISLANEALLIVQQQGLIQGFNFVAIDAIEVMLKDRAPIRQSIPSTIAFCRGVLEGARVTRESTAPNPVPT